MRWMLRNLDIKLAVAVDPWEPPREKQAEAFKTYRANAMHNLAPWIRTGQLQIAEMTSREYFRSIPDRPQFDLIYIDGDHRGVECLEDLAASFRVVKRGGWIIVDDLNRVYHNGKPLVYMAVYAFELVYKGRVVREWIDGRQIAFRKL